MANRNQANPPPTRAGVCTRIKSVVFNYTPGPTHLTFCRNRGVFETAHGVSENFRGRTLGAIDNIAGSSESKSHHASLADRGRMEAETGMAHVSGYADPNAYRDELDRKSNSTTQTFGNDRATGTGHGRGYGRAEEEDNYGRDSRVDGGVGRGMGGYGRADDGRGRPMGVQGFEQQPLPAIDRNIPGPVTDQKGRLSSNPNRQNASSEAGWTSISQAGSLTPTQQRMKRDFPPELPPRPQTQATDNDHHGQIYQ